MKDNCNFGGKANSLIKLRDNGFNVPNFFIISSEKYLKFIKNNGLDKKIESLIKENKYEEVKSLIMDADFDEELKNEIYENYSKLNSKLVSVRSSASNEDGAEKSFAGQYNTYLNVDVDNLFESIKKCWCSLYSENVILYSDEINISGMNVVVQQMIEADYAGVAFSIDPTNDTNNYSVIEIVKGVGEKLVSGEVTPTKFIVRRETRHVDLKIGELSLEDSLIEELETVILDIEKLYELPVDIEFAILDNHIFILQTRPITAFTPLCKPFSLTISRPNSLIEEGIYFRGEFEGIKGLTRNLYYFKPLFLYNVNHKNTEIYYNLMDLEEDPTQMYYYMDLDYEDILKKYESIKVKIKNLDNIIDNNLNFNVRNYIADLIEIFSFTSLGQLSGHFESISERLKNLLYEFRLNYDYIVHKASDHVIDKMKEELPFEYKEYVNFIELDEYINNKLPGIEELIKRTKGYIYYGKLYVVSDYEKWMRENNFVIQEDDSINLKGQVVYGGNVKGRVCKIFNEDDFDKFKTGDILVTPMTTPKFIKLIKKASAIVTDEGGITCHAAIVSRELKIPCVVGCKNVTKVLNDGDIILINGSTGEVKQVN